MASIWLAYFAGKQTARKEEAEALLALTSTVNKEKARTREKVKGMSDDELWKNLEGWH